MLNLSCEPALHHHRLSIPDFARCPRCGLLVERHTTTTRRFWEASLIAPTITELQIGTYICPCCPPGERWFCTPPPGYQTPSQYSLRAQEILLALVNVRKMSLENAAGVATEIFHLPHLAPSTIQSWMRKKAEALDIDTHQAEALAAFSGQLAVDEVYDKDWCQLTATDPLNDVQLDTELLDHPATEEDVVAFFQRLKARGLHPTLVVTDGSKLYPKAIMTVWPTAAHQLCVFHFLMGVNRALAKVFSACVAALPTPPKRKRGRPKKVGRPRKDKKKRANIASVRKLRYLIFQRPTHIDPAATAALTQGFLLCPELRILRRFILALYALFGPETTTLAEAEHHRQALLADLAFQANPVMRKILAQLADDGFFEKLTRYHEYEEAEKTSNHVERENRTYRHHQKARYRYRSHRSILALIHTLRVRKGPRAKRRQLCPRALPSAKGVTCPA